MRNHFRLPLDETQADAWAFEALASVEGTKPCWQYFAAADVFVEPPSPFIRGRRRAIPAERVEALRAAIDPSRST